eukprot:COSAG01_NODE_54820_length_329_cov_1.030435_2_plen_71_part_01
MACSAREGGREGEEKIEPAVNAEPSCLGGPPTELGSRESTTTQTDGGLKPPVTYLLGRWGGIVPRGRREGQ